MTDTLGYLIWWKVGDVDLDHDQLAKILDGTDMTPPARPLPIDVYRRVTGANKLTYQVPTGTLELTTVPVDNPSDKMMARHIVGTMKDAAGVTQVIRKAGDVAFYKPPRGKNTKARMRVTASAPLEEWADPVQIFADQLRVEYERGVKGQLDGQAVRRLIRATLAQHKALYLDGPYFVQAGERHGTLVTTLLPLFAALGDDSFLHSVPMPDGNTHRAFLARGLERAVEAGTEIDETIWKVVSDA